jgi:membrane fusion protein (multidrug efflux system)
LVSSGVELVLFDRCAPEDARQVLALVGPDIPVVIVDDHPPEAFGGDRQLFFVAPTAIALDDLAEVIRSALEQRTRPVAADLSVAQAAHVKRILERAAQIGRNGDLAVASRDATEAVVELVDADRAHCLFHEAASGLLWTESVPPRQTHASSGLAGFAARTGRAQAIPAGRLDPRYRREIDDPQGDDRQRLLVQPLVGPDASVHAVLVAVRAAHRPAFAPSDVATMAMFAERTGPLLHHLALRVEAEAVLEQDENTNRGPFRAQALHAHRERAQPGAVIRILPRWVPWTFRSLVALVACALVYLFVGRVNIYSKGPAVIRLLDRLELTTDRAGAIEEIYVVAGQTVERGQLLGRFEDDVARDALARLEESWAASVRRHMADLGDAAAAADVERLRREFEDARAHLAEHEVRAPRSGTVSDLRIRVGQHLVAGDVLLSIAQNNASNRVVALLPGSDRPRIEPGMALRLELPGYPRNYQTVVIETAGDEIIGPDEARRFIGPTRADALEMTGPLVLVEASLPGPEFRAGEHWYRYHDGMPAEAELALRNARIIELLIPTLEGRFEGRWF